MVNKVIFLTANPGTNQTWIVPSDWSTSNTVECFGGGSGGINGISITDGGGGGAGGAYALSENLTGIVAGGNVTYQCGVGGAVATAGGNTWFNSSSFPFSGQACGAVGGGIGTTTAGGAGGQGSNCYTIGPGANANSGGNGGSSTTGNVGGGGGGGAGGPNGAGTNGTNNSGSTGGAGGSGDAGFGGAGGAAFTVGNPGAEYTATGGGTAGAGGGGGGATVTSGVAATGGNYGAGGGGGAGLTTTAAAAGVQGFIVITYSPGITTLIASGRSEQNILKTFRMVGY